jgi:hypothetical protein
VLKTLETGGMFDTTAASKIDLGKWIKLSVTAEFLPSALATLVHIYDGTTSLTTENGFEALNAPIEDSVKTLAFTKPVECTTADPCADFFMYTLDYSSVVIQAAILTTRGFTTLDSHCFIVSPPTCC